MRGIAGVLWGCVSLYIAFCWVPYSDLVFPGPNSYYSNVPEFLKPIVFGLIAAVFIWWAGVFILGIPGFQWGEAKTLAKTDLRSGSANGASETYIFGGKNAKRDVTQTQHRTDSTAKAQADPSGEGSQGHGPFTH